MWHLQSKKHLRAVEWRETSSAEMTVAQALVRWGPNPAEFGFPIDTHPVPSYYVMGPGNTVFCRLCNGKEAAGTNHMRSDKHIRNVQWEAIRTGAVGLY